jgi:hypothetical protein
MSDDFGMLVVGSDEVIVITAGEQGPRGANGSGGGGAGDYLEHAFSAATLVVVNHNFGRRPAVQLLSPGSQLMSAGVSHPSVNQVSLVFNTPQAGLAILTA